MTAWRSKTLAAVLALSVAAPASAAVLTGTVRSRGAQNILVPPSMSSPVVLRYYAEDGSHVDKGDPILRIDAGQAAQQLQQLRDKITQTRVTTNKEVADLELKRIDAEIELSKSEAAEATAKVDAKLPRKLLSGLDYDRYQGEYERSRRQTILDRSKLADARAAVARRRHDGGLSLRKLQLQLTFLQSQVDTATVYAARAGTVVHDFQTVSINGSQVGRFEQGSTSFPGSRVGQVVDVHGTHDVRAWALQPDRRDLKVGQRVSLHFDALPGRELGGRIRSISGATDAKPEWGDGRYYSVDIDMDAAARDLPLLPGMSVRVDTDPGTGTSTQPHAAAHAATPRMLKATGEIYARQSVLIAPPAIEGLWQMNITQMAGDGAKVKKGQTIVVFGGGDLMQKLPAAQAQLAEKKRTQEQLRLQLADQARDATMATAKARADAEKARRKAMEPEKYVAGVKYAKLVVDRHRAEQVLKLTEQRERIAAQSRSAQQAKADAEVEQAQSEVQRLQKAVGQLTVHAPRAGIFLHETMWNGDKIDTGSQVWRGVAVADIPDMSTLAARANLPERDLQEVHTGEKVEVILTGGAARHVPGTIVGIGRSVHSKSRAEPVPVIDLDISLHHPGMKSLKPGQPIRVEIAPTGKEASS